MTPCRLAVIGAGTIGKTHILHALQCPDIEIVGVAESQGPAVDWVRAQGLPCVAGHAELLERFKPQGVVIATPNDLHASMALDVLLGQRRPGGKTDRRQPGIGSRDRAGRS